MRLRYLYVGSSDTERDLAAWLALDGASMSWRFQHFGADVAAIAFAEEGAHPAVLLADHRPAGSVLPIYAGDDPAALSARLCSSGWEVVAGPMGTPRGPGDRVAQRERDRAGVAPGRARGSDGMGLRRHRQRARGAGRNDRVDRGRGTA